MTSKELTITNPKGQKLAATIEIASDNKEHIVILVHGYASNRNRESTRLLSEELTRRGINSIRFDINGNGQSEGYFGDQTISSAIADLRSVYDHVKEMGFERISIFGSSAGGITTTGFALEEKDIFRIGLKAPVSDYPAQRLRKYGQEGIDKWKDTGFFEYVTSAGDVFKVRYDFFEDSKKYIMYDKAKDIEVPVLILHGDADTVVELEQSKRLVEELPQGSLVIIEGAEHDLKINGSKMESTLMFADWFEKGV